MRYINSLFVLVLGAALATFIWSNYAQKVTVHFTDYLYTVEISLSLALFCSMLAGFVLATILSLGNHISLRKRVRMAHRQNMQLESELAELRKLPLTESLQETPSASDQTGAST